MKKIIVLSMSLILLVGLCYAGEKEELQLQKALLEERLLRLQAEFALAKLQLKGIEEKIQVVEQGGKKEGEEK